MQEFSSQFANGFAGVRVEYLAPMVFVPTLDVDARILGAGPPHAASAPAWSTALVGV